MSTTADPAAPEGGLEALIAERRAKARALRDAGVDPFPARFPGRVDIASVREANEGLEAGETGAETVRVAGRLAARRGQGKVAFLDLEDRSGRIQLWASIDRLGEEAMAALLDLDLGDILGVAGPVTRTRRGELSIAVDEAVLLAKSLRPPPDKHAGLKDPELRFRRRYLDLMSDPGARAAFVTRAKAIAAVRRFLDDRGFVEVETPTLQPIYGGAAARPFVTHHNALDRDLYLRIATELYLKRCIVGGLEKVYELGKDFRNEGVSHKHNPEFTMVETYEAYADYRDVMEMLEQMVADRRPRGHRRDDRRLEGAGDRPRAAVEARRLPRRPPRGERGGRARAPRRGLRCAPRCARPAWRRPTACRGASSWTGSSSQSLEPTLIQPTILYDYPLELSPFAKRKPDEPDIVERFEAFAGGMEIGNAFTELNDPDDQRERFAMAAADRAAGDDEAQPMDEEFLTALEHGMPPTGGLGLGIDRLVMLLTDRHTIREVILFPAMRS